MSALSPATQASTFPEKPLRLVVPFPAGGPTDVVGRIIATDWHARLGQPVIVENKAGAVGFIGHEEVRKAPADGYTLLAMVIPAVVNYEFLGKEFELPRDFTPIGMVYTQYNVLVVNPERAEVANVTNVPQLFEAAKTHKDKLDYTSAGNGSLGHLTMTRLANRSGASLIHIPYRGSMPALQDLLAGQVPIMFADSFTAGPYIANGRLRALAVTSAERVPELPDVPTLVEQGYEGEVILPWYGLAAPPGTPTEIVDRLNATLKETLSDPVIKEKLAGLGFTPHHTSPKEFSDWVNNEFATWRKVIRENNIVVNR